MNDLHADLLDLVRSSCRAVVERARHVRIREERLADYARGIEPDRAPVPDHDAACHYLGHGEAGAAFFLTLAAVNFGSGYFPSLRKRSGMSGYYSIAASLTDRFRARGPLSANELALISPPQCAAIFGQDLGREPIAELMGLFAASLNDLGRNLIERFAGSFVGLIEAAGRSAERLVGLLRPIEFFEDVEPYGGMEVFFFKRAQLVAADLARAFAGEGLGRFDDLDRLTVFADNVVPHVLRVDGVLEYDGKLAARIDAGDLLAGGSPEEVELRASAVHCAELLCQRLGDLGRPATPMQLDYFLWNRGQDAAYKRAHPRHRTRSVFY